MPSSFNFNKFWKANKWVLAISISIVVLFFCWLFKPDVSGEETNYTGLSNLSLDTTVVKPKRKICKKKNELECKRIIEGIFDKPFISIRPDWLKYPKTKRNLEIDMYNEELNIGLEYDGKQHRTYSIFFHRKYEDFVKQQERDEWKNQRCKELGITLIRVPDTVKFKDLEIYIKDQLIINGKSI